MRSFFKKMTGSRLRPAMGRRRLFACLLLMRWLLPGAAAQAPPAAPEVVVVGGGLSGTFAALQAARLGASVLLLEISTIKSGGGKIFWSGLNLEARSFRQKQISGS
jgi:hypothetical protein